MAPSPTAAQPTTRSTKPDVGLLLVSVTTGAFWLYRLASSSERFWGCIAGLGVSIVIGALALFNSFPRGRRVLWICCTIGLVAAYVGLYKFGR